MSLLWTIASVEDVLSTDDGSSTVTHYKEIEYGGIKMMVSPVKDGMGKIERLISPIPSDYLRPEFQPGRLVPMYMKAR